MEFYTSWNYEKTDSLYHHIGDVRWLVIDITIGDFCLFFLISVRKLMNQFISRILTSCLKFPTTLQECFFFFHHLPVDKCRFFLIKGLVCSVWKENVIFYACFKKISHISALFSTNGSVAKLLCTVWIDWLFLRSSWVFCGEVSTDSCLLLRLLFHLFVFSSIIVQILRFFFLWEK